MSDRPQDNVPAQEALSADEIKSAMELLDKALSTASVSGQGNKLAAWAYNNGARLLATVKVLSARIAELESAQAVPEGFVLVPVEPTEAMISSALNVSAYDGDGEFEPLCGLLSFIGERKARVAVKAALQVSLKAAAPSSSLPAAEPLKAKIIPYTYEDDSTPDPAMAGLVMLAIGEEDEIPDHVLDRIPEGAAQVICDVINAAAPSVKETAQ